MYGLDAIASHNGWAMSIVGIFIVFTGLTLLSFAISQLHKVLNMWEKREEIILKVKSPFKKKKIKKSLSSVFTSVDFTIGVQQFRLLVKTLKEPFSLPKLLELAVISGLSRPYSTLSKLLDAGIIFPDNKGYFYWDQSVLTTMAKNTP